MSNLLVCRLEGSIRDSILREAYPFVRLAKAGAALKLCLVSLTRHLWRAALSTKPHTLLQSRCCRVRRAHLSANILNTSTPGPQQST